MSEGGLIRDASERDVPAIVDLWTEAYFTGVERLVFRVAL